ncbi:MAG: hypothetical protein ACR2MD_13155 [Aridibacter sp.]
MDKKFQNLHTDEWLKEIRLRSESEGYKPEEMITCKKCQRKNPPTRLNCMYCGVDLVFDEGESQRLKPILRKMESHIKGFNLIYTANLETWNEIHLSEVSKMTRISKTSLQRLFESKKSMPLARVETKKEIEIVAKRLSENGINTRILGDDEFKEEKFPRRLRRIEFSDDKLIFILFNNDEILEVKNQDINLIVAGALFEKKLESTEKYKKNKESKILETDEISSDEFLLDIYTKNDLIGYRISQKGFDFSCLGGDKKMLATENIKILISKLRNFSPNAEFDGDYLKVRESLSQVWEIEERKESKGLKRKSFGSFNRQNITTTNNLLQFTKYSRLQWLLKSGE